MPLTVAAGHRERGAGGYSSPDEMMEKELTIRPDWVRKAVACLSQRKVDGPVSKLQIDDAIAKAEAEPLAAHRRPTKKEQEDKGENITFAQERGTSQHYLLRRLLRDHPDLVQQIGPGKPYRSARAAAIAAGIVKDVPTVRLTEPSRIAEALWSKLSREELAMLVAALTERLTAAD